MKHISDESENGIGTHMKLSSIYYERNFEIYNPLVSRFELFILSVLSIFLPVQLLRDDFIVTGQSKIVYLSIGLLIFVCFVRKIFWGVKKESVFIVKSLGLQATVTYCSNLKSSKFIPWHLIDDVIINEAILMQRVIYYLAVLVKTEDTSANCEKTSIVPLFLNAQPRLAALKEIYSNIQAILDNN